MDRKLVGAMLLLLASTGCRMCSSCCDNLPPVLDGPYPNSGGRVGSAFGGTLVAQPLSQSEIFAPTPEESAPKESAPEESTVEEEPPEDLTAAIENQNPFARPLAAENSPVSHFADTDD